MSRLVARDEKWDRRFLDVAALFATWSKDISTKVGAVVVNDCGNIHAEGFNGFARGVNDDADDRHARPAKYRWVVHAEQNCIAAAARHGVSLEGCTLYCTHPTCADCAKLIIQAGIRRVVYFDRMIAGWEEQTRIASKMFEEARVLVCAVAVE